MSSGPFDYMSVLPEAQDHSFQPSQPEVVEDPGFWQRTKNSWELGTSVQAIERMVEWTNPTDPDFDPLKQPELKGNERFAPWLREARSRPEFEAMLARYTENEGQQRINALHGSIWNELAAGVAAPENFLIPGVGLGGGILKTAAKAALLEATAAVPLAAIANKVDPTHAPGHE